MGQIAGYDLSHPVVIGNIAFYCRHTVNTKNTQHTPKIKYLTSTRQICFCWYFNYIFYEKSAFVNLDFPSPSYKSLPYWKLLRALPDIAQTAYFSAVINQYGSELRMMPNKKPEKCDSMFL